MESKNVKLGLIILVVAVFASALIYVQLRYVAPYVRTKWINPQRVASHNNDGAEAYRQGDLDKAIAEFSETLKLDPQNVFALNWRANAYSMKRAWDKAISDYNEVVRLAPFTDGVYFNRGMCWSQKGEFQRALEDYNEAIKRHFEAPGIYHARGAVYMRLGDWTNAIADLDKAIDLGASDIGVFMSRAAAHEGTGNMRLALADYREAILKSPNDYHIQNNLAWFLATCPDASLRNGPEAVRLATKACETSNWNLSYCVDTLAAAEAEAGDFSAAIKYQKQAISLSKEAEENARMTKRLALYEQGKPHQEPAKRQALHLLKK